ncbi:MFS transporter [Actinomadura sp. DC4]|uniref:MFS transporter n=1 Tax=Actinomadura sp. DC4 TaxID=3055069 RepID=UPI0025B124D1|nr:MFS transporter [Actinomadura sp. DC4]MDN3351336.1 MFS transporter [Actinomadura sp. DC4]
MPRTEEDRAGSRDFAIYWLSQSVSMLGDAFATAAFPLLVLQTTGSVAQMGVTAAIGGVSMIVSGLFAGSLVDRTRPRTVIIACDVFRAALYLAIPLCWLAGPRLWPLYATAALGSASAVLFQAAHASVLTGLVGRERLTAANGLYEAGGATAFVVGPPLAGGVAAAFGATAAIGLDGVSFALSAVGMLFVQVCPSRDRHHDGAAAVPKPSHDLRACLSFLWHRPPLRRLLVLMAVTAIPTYGLVDLFIYHVRHDLGQRDGTVGLVLGAAGAGAVAGALLADRIRRRYGFAACMVGSYVLSGFATALLGVVTDLVSVVAIAAAYSFGASLALVCATSVRQEMTPDGLMGRVTSVFTTAQLALGAAGAVALTMASARIGVRAVALVVAALLMSTAAMALLTGLVRMSSPDR